jgi:hypothetical protein
MMNAAGGNVTKGALRKNDMAARKAAVSSCSICLDEQVQMGKVDEMVGAQGSNLGPLPCES